ncbi:S8 family peptidase [Micromonospora auratinigra]|uniref:PA domain-containing protein n=1 Tax=Micromonospora auratinigra TaxID=261654 RepID=A0A1A8Z8I1_9ACTN|nr:S8 family serine peptidase [Micromonospora auratinigra]SBT40167.1 PA domain-containing protein [Micromonospora auratinigra]
MIRIPRVAAVGVAAALTTALLPLTAAAAPEAAAGPGLPGPARVDAVTLITGDRAVLRTAPDGSRTTTLDRDGVPTSDYLTRQHGDDLYVIPAEAVPLIGRGFLDEELFNVTGLVAQGYDDAASESIPLLTVATGAAARRAVPVPPAATRGRALPSAAAVAFTAPKEKAAAVFDELTDEAGSGVRVWLDRKVSATLDRSVAAVGAPTAWAAGLDGSGTKVAVLDSGYDPGHPDLAGKVVAAQNFTGTWKIDDRHGHGTHVASTVAGTGAASAGKHQGVAPGTELLIGKVLDDSGAGQTSWIIAGMEWAVAQGADVVNMSLGGATTDCTDPLAQATERLASTTGALFVVAAGNDGPRRATVGSPGCAPSVLTVGAVDDAGATAGFSSRGPVAGGPRAKPDLAAPGVDILAARAGGRGDDAYVAMSGTSMATPHVAGAAAILAGQHPDWTPARLKAALVSAAHPRQPSRVQEQGAGMLDIPRTTTQRLLGPGLVDLAAFGWPHERGETATREITWTNTGDAPVTVELTLDTVTGEDGRPAPDDMVTLGATRLTVPAGGTASVPVTVDSAVKLPLEAYGSFGGRIIARDTTGGQEVVTPIAFWVEPKTVTLTLRTTDRRGEGPTFGSTVEVTGLDDAGFQRYYPLGIVEKTLRLRAGRYALSGFLFSGEPGTTGNQGVPASVAYFGDPEILLDRDTVIDWDARTAHRIRVEGDRPTEHQGVRLDYGRWWDRWLVTGGVSLSKYVDEVYAAPTGKAKTGGFEFSAAWRSLAPELSVTVAGDDSPVPAEYLPLSPDLPDSHAADLVDAGAGSAAELTAAGAAGKLVLVNTTSATTARSAVTAAKAAGATGVVLAHDAPGRWLPQLTGGGPVLPTVSVTPAVEQRLRERLAAGPVRLGWAGIPLARSPYVYHFGFTADDRLDGDRHLKYHDQQLARVDADWYTQGQPARYHDTVFVQRPYGVRFGIGAYQIGIPTPLDAPVTRPEFYTPDATIWWHGAYSGVYNSMDSNGPVTYAAAGTGSETWYRQPARPGVGWSTGGDRAPIAVRQGRTMTVSVPLWRDADPDHVGQAAIYDSGRMELYRNGELYARGRNDQPGYAQLTVPDDEAAYRLRLSVQRSPNVDPAWRMSFATETNWRFRSTRPTDQSYARLPLLLPEYDLALNRTNQAPAETAYPVRLTGTGQPGYDAGRVVAARAWVSYGDPVQLAHVTDWVEVPVVRDGDDWVARVDNTPAAGRYVSLKVDLTDEHGNGVEQTIVRAYGVP